MRQTQGQTRRQSADSREGDWKVCHEAKKDAGETGNGSRCGDEIEFHFFIDVSDSRRNDGRIVMARLTVIAQLPLRLVLAVSLQVYRMFAETPIAAIGEDRRLQLFRTIARSGGSQAHIDSNDVCHGGKCGHASAKLR